MHSRETQALLLLKEQIRAASVTRTRDFSKDSKPLLYSSQWIELHEYAHVDLCHFQILEGIPTFFLVGTSPRRTHSVPNLPREIWNKVERCLELQADHEAMDIMLGPFSDDEWSELRTKIVSIAAVMVLIEKIDAENACKNLTHPKAATRVFQLLGHVTEMWSIAVQLNEGVELPDQKSVQMFSKKVILPAFWDTVAMAKAINAMSIIADLGSPEDFFADVARAKLGEWDDLVTVGAREWAELKDANDQILPLLPINQATT